MEKGFAIKGMDWWPVAVPVAVCIAVTGYAALAAPTWSIVVTAILAATSCSVGVFSGVFGLVSLSGAFAIISCSLSILENRAVHWGEPALLCMGIAMMMEVGHIACIMRTPEVNPELMPSVDEQADRPTAEPADRPADHPGNAAMFRRLTPRIMARVAAAGGASLAITYLYLRVAASNTLHDNDMLFLMLVGAVAVSVGAYLLMRISVEPRGGGRPLRR